MSISTKGDNSPVFIGDKNKNQKNRVDRSKNKEAFKFGSIGFIIGVAASLVANWIWHLIQG